MQTPDKHSLFSILHRTLACGWLLCVLVPALGQDTELRKVNYLCFGTTAVVDDILVSKNASWSE